MTGKEFEQIIRISFERKKFTNLIIDKKLFRNFAHVYCKSAVRPGKFHYNLKKKTEVKALLWLLLRSFFFRRCATAPSCFSA